MENQLISVILPIYNVELYLKECIESVIHQTYRNLEIILVDDGSTDNSSEICDSYLKVDDRIKVIHKKNGGLSDARNVGIDASNGEYIALIDSDDLVHCQFIEDLYHVCAESNLLVSACRYVDFTDSKDITNSTNNSKSVLTGRNYIKSIYEGSNVKYGFVAWNKLYHRSLFNKIKYPVGRIYEDTFTTYKLLLEAENVGLIDSELYYYRIRSESIMTQRLSFKKVKDGVDADASVVKYFFDHYDKDLLTKTSSYFCKQTISTYYKSIKYMDKDEIQESKYYLKSIYRNTWKYCKKTNMGFLKKVLFGFIYIIWKF